MEIKLKKFSDTDIIWMQQQENAKLRRELNFYAHKPNYRRNLTDSGVHLVSIVHKDNGKRARTLLSELGGNRND